MSQALRIPIKINNTTAPARMNSACTGTTARAIAPTEIAPYPTKGRIVYHVQSSKSALYTVSRLVRYITRRTDTTPQRPMSAAATAACTRERHGARRTAETSNAAAKYMTVGVVNAAIASWVPSARSFPVTKVITTNINPVNAAADEPVMT